MRVPRRSLALFNPLSIVSLVAPARAMSLSGKPSPPVIDSAIHVWSSGEQPYPWANPPPADLQSAALPSLYVNLAKSAGVDGALIVQPANHMYDHRFVTKALKEYPDFFRGVGLANPTLAPAEAVAALEALHADGYVGVRFNAGNFEGGLNSAVGQALYKRAGELGMSVSILAFGGLAPFARDLEALCAAYPSTTLILDHLGFFRQPATGGLLADAATNDETSWAAVIALAKHPQVLCKVSALFRASAEPPPFRDLAPRVEELLAVYGPTRLMWGSDYPFVLPGGFPLPAGVTQTPAKMGYPDAVAVLRQWGGAAFDDKALGALMGGTAARAFKF